MKVNLRSIWSLLFGVGLIGIAVGSQNSLLGIRASIEGFTNQQIGFIMSAYFFGFMVGSANTIKAINRVGHVRVFAALTALLSITILLHSLNIHVISWATLRFLTGIAVSGIWVVSESWLNQSTNNQNRGSLISIYMMVINLGMTGGQLMLSVSEPQSFVLYSLISVIVSIAAIPILMSSITAPKITEYQSISLMQLFKLTPAGTVGIFITGMVNAITLGMGAVFASKLGLSVVEISYYIAAILMGGVLLQWPLGKLSDITDRRVVTAIVALSAAIVAIISMQMTVKDYSLLVMLAFVFGGLSLTLYSLFNALANDFLNESQVMSASGGLLIIKGLGATLGPIFVSFIMDIFGLAGFYLTLATLCLLISLFCFYRVIFYKIKPGHSTNLNIQPVPPINRFDK
jgi:MFS family permease